MTTGSDHRGLKRKRSWCPLVCVNTIYGSVNVIFFIVECGIARFLCMMLWWCMYSTFGHHPHPLGYLCVKFHFFRDLHCWTSVWRKIAHSISHSLSQIIWFAGNWIRPLSRRRSPNSPPAEGSKLNRLRFRNHSHCSVHKLSS